MFLQPPLAKIADNFGRLELILLSVFFYILGTIVEATSTGVKSFCAGAVIYRSSRPFLRRSTLEFADFANSSPIAEVGYTAIILLVEVVIADVSSLRNRVFWSYIPSVSFSSSRSHFLGLIRPSIILLSSALPFLINTWISGDVSQAVLVGTTWQWGIGVSSQWFASRPVSTRNEPGKLIRISFRLPDVVYHLSKYVL